MVAWSAYRKDWTIWYSNNWHYVWLLCMVLVSTNTKKRLLFIYRTGRMYTHWEKERKPSRAIGTRSDSYNFRGCANVWKTRWKTEYRPHHRLWSTCMLWSPSRVNRAFIFLSKLFFCEHILWCCSWYDWHICYCYYPYKFYWHNTILYPNRGQSITAILFVIL